LSPNSQKKLNYFNTDICDISITKKLIHNIDKCINPKKDLIQSMEEKPTSKFRYNPHLLNNEDVRYLTERGNLSTRNLSDYNILKSETQNDDNKIKNNNNSQRNEYRNRIDFPKTISCFNDSSPRNYCNSKANNLNSEYLCDDTNITNYDHNFNAYNENCDVEDINDSCGNNYLNNTMNNLNYNNTNNNLIFDPRQKKNSNNHSCISERNILINQRKNFNIENSHNIDVSPKSINSLNYNQTIKKSEKDQGDFSSKINNNHQANFSKNNEYLETLYYGPDNSYLNGTQNSGISSINNLICKFIFKL